MGYKGKIKDYLLNWSHLSLQNKIYIISILDSLSDEKIRYLYEELCENNVILKNFLKGEVLDWNINSIVSIRSQLNRKFKEFISQLEMAEEWDKRQELQELEDKILLI
jgi:hypothetical protein